MNNRTKALGLATVLAIAACTASPTEQFAAMCAEQKANDPSTYAVSEKACIYQDNLPDEVKLTMVNGYNELKRARESVKR